MAITKFDSLSINSSKGEWALKGVDLLKEENSAYLAEIQSLGEGKGIPFSFKEGEVITFPAFEEMGFVKRTVTFKEKDYAVLSVLAESNFRKDIEVPLSIFRRLPAFDEDRKVLFDKAPLTEELLQSQLGDLGRAKLLAGTKVKIAKEYRFLRQTFSSTPQGFVRDGEETIKAKGEYVVCYKTVAA